MPKILLILSVVFMLGSAVLGYLNKSKLDEATVARATAESAVGAAKDEATKAKAALKETGDKLTAETVKVTEMEQTVTAKEAELAKATADVTNLTAQLTDKTAALDAANAEKERLVAAAAAAPALTEVAPAPAANADQVAELTAQIDALKSEKQIIGDKLVAAESKTKELGDLVARQKAAVMAKGLEGQVVAVNQAWGFVVLNLGDRSGVVNNAEMVVMRDGDRIGKVKITSVEPSSSIADIVSNSVSTGQRVQAGDRVIFSGTN
ncbi:MAG TPA: hypothetical protein VF585_00030 [Chthoniobacterales bacterium]|jgi:hypothetical protein